MREEIVTLGCARATRYALRDKFRGLPDIPVYRVNEAGQLKHLGQLVPVRPDGFVMVSATGGAQYSEGLPWWLGDMRPQGFLGRAFARQNASRIGLPPDVRHWSDSDALHALLAHGSDTVGNLLLGDLARDRFVNAQAPTALGAEDYPRLAAEALTTGETWSSAGGEQPKFCAYTDKGHVLVKFSARDDNPVSARWRDLLLAEHLALETLTAGGIPAARSNIVDSGGQRFLELERFDRVGPYGRRELMSLASLDGEFVARATAPWPVVTSELAKLAVITSQAHAAVQLLYAFGILIGNTDMHSGNLSFVGDQGRPYAPSPAYDMLPMAFSPTAGGSLGDVVPKAHLHASVASEQWAAARVLARQYLERLGDGNRFSNAFRACIDALHVHLDEASKRIDRLG